MKGPQLGHFVVGVKFRLEDGASHAVDSNEHAFRAATWHAFRQAFAKANPVILEPIMRATVECPIEFQV